MSRAPQHQRCPFCLSRLDGSTEVTGEDAQPKEGDLGVCYYCGGYVCYDKFDMIRALSNDELESLTEIERTQMIAASARIAEFNQLYPRQV